MNSKNAINASNVTDATVAIKFETNTNKVPVTAELTIIDEEDNKLPLLSTEIAAYETETRIQNVDFSSLVDGMLDIKVVLKDDQGNIKENKFNSVIEKKAEDPIVKYTTVKRTSSTGAKINGLIKINKTDTVYCLVKEATESAPTVDEVIKYTKNTANVSPLSNNADTGGDKNITITNGNGDKEYIAYLAVETVKGTTSSKVIPVKIATSNAKQLENTNLVVTKKTSEKATFEWTYDDETDGLTGYKAILKKNDIAVAEKTIELGNAKEVNFFDEMKKYADTSATTTYDVFVVALGNGKDFEDSVEKKCAEQVKVDPVATNVTITAPALNTTMFTWKVGASDDVSNISDYTVEVVKYNALNNTYENVKTFNILETSYDIAELAEENGIGEYGLNVTANAKADVLKVSKESAKVSTSAGAKYYQVEPVKNLAISKIETNSITLTGTLLPKVYSVTPTYTLYVKKANETFQLATPTSNVLSFPVKVTNLTPNTEYSFKLVTKVGNTECVSEVATGETTAEVSKIKDTTKNTDFQYVKYQAQNSVEPTPSVSQLPKDKITYNEGVLYIDYDGKTVVAYDSTVEGAEDVIDVLKQLDITTTKLQITNSKISKLEFVTDTKQGKMYDLSKVAQTAEVTITGNAKNATVNGTIKNLTLKNTSSVFDLSGLAISDKVTINATGSTLSVANNTKLTFSENIAKVTVNNVVINKTGSSVKLGDMTVKENGVLDITGDGTNALTVDSSAANNEVKLNFITTAQRNLTLTASENSATKITNIKQGSGELKINSGKVDFRGDTLPFKKIIANANNTANAKTIIVTSGSADESLSDRLISNGVGDTLINGSEFKFKASVAHSATAGATYSTTASSGDITLNIKSGTVEITK